MFPDGVCRVKPGYFTKTIQFQDINYQLNQNEDKTAIFEGWCDFLNYFDSSVKFQLSFMNMAANKDTYGQSIVIPSQGDDFDNIREEYTDMLRSQLARGNNGLIKTKYLTFGIEAANVKEAKPRLDRIETDLLNNFKRLGVAAEPLNGKQRLALMHGMFHIDEHTDFNFEWEWLAPSGLSVKDFIAPSSFEFRNGKEFGVGKKLGAVSFLQILAPELNDRMQSYRAYYDEINVYNPDEKIYPKAAHQSRNRNMVDRSDLVVFYVEHEYGGTWQTMKYAVNQKKKIINLVTK